MSKETHPVLSPKPASTSLVFKLALVFILVFLVIVFLPLFFMAGQVGVIGAIALGWWQFLRRTLPGISWNWDIVGMWILCVLLILSLAHAFLRWITNSIGSRRGQNWHWPWRWTWCGLTSVMLLFLVGMSVGGAAHQIGWLTSSQEPWFESKGGIGVDINNMRQLDGAFQQALLESNEDLERACRALRNPHCEYLRQQSGDIPMLQKYHFLLILEGTNKVVGTILFPRDAQGRGHYLGMY